MGVRSSRPPRDSYTLHGNGTDSSRLLHYAIIRTTLRVGMGPEPIVPVRGSNPVPVQCD